jgi:hypothetical protein
LGASASTHAADVDVAVVADEVRAVGGTNTADADAAAAAAQEHPDYDPERAVGAPPDIWRRRGTSAATRKAVAEVKAARTVKKMTQDQVTKLLVEFAFGGSEPRLGLDERRRFPSTQSVMSKVLIGERPLSDAAAKVVEAWAHGIRTSTGDPAR